MEVLEGTPWGTDWAWSLPLILLNVITHVFGLAFIYDGFIALFGEINRRSKFMFRFAVTMSAAVVLIGSFMESRR